MPDLLSSALPGYPGLMAAGQEDTGSISAQLASEAWEHQPRDRQGRWESGGSDEWDPFAQTLDEYRESQRPEQVPPSQTDEYWHPVHLYHGTSAQLSPGDMVTPGHGGPNYVNTLDKRQSNAYATPHTTQAVEAAHNAVLQRGGHHHIYEVERAPDMYPDPESGYGIGGPENMSQPGWRSPTGFRVVRELSPDEVRAAADKAGIDMAATPASCCPSCGCPDPSSISGQIELGYDPAEPRGKGGEWIGALQARHPDVQLEISPHGDRAGLSLIRTTGQRGMGLAHSALKDLISEADRRGITLHLTPEPLAGDRSTSKGRLTSWYVSQGFVHNKGRNKDYEISDTMYRPPRTGT